MEKNDFLVDGKYSVVDLVDLDMLRKIFEKFTEATGFTIGFLDHPEMKVLIDSGWKDICTKFHRSCPLSEENCTKSNRHLLDQLNEEGQVVVEACENGLVDCATPVVIRGKHIASLATGQLLLAEPDMERFKKQAKIFGFDESQYLEALKEIPVFPEEQVRKVTAYLGEMAAMIASLGYGKLEIKEKTDRLDREICERIKAEEKLVDHRKNLEKIVEARTNDLMHKVVELEKAATHIGRLEGLVPICFNCKKMQQEANEGENVGEWVPLEKYISDRSETLFSHGLCPECAKKMRESRGS